MPCEFRPKASTRRRRVLHLAMEYPEVVTIHQIAARHRISVKYLEQILLELKRGGILTSRRGVHGGYLLSRNPSEISVGEVLQNRGQPLHRIFLRSTRL
jgi:Rrf2 family protein